MVRDGGTANAALGSEGLAAPPPLTGPERRLRTVLRIIGVSLLAAAVVYFVGPFIHPLRSLFREPPFVSNSVVKVSILGLAALYAAGDVRRRIGVAAIVIAGHLVSLAAMAIVLAFGRTGARVDLWVGHASIRTVLWGAIALDALITVALLGFFIPCWRAVRSEPGEPAPAAEPPLTPAERRLRVALIVFAVGFAAGAVVYELGPLLHTSRDFFRQLPFVTNSVVKVATMAMLVGYAASNLRRNMALVGPVIVVHFLSPLVGFAYLLFIDTSYQLPLLGGHVQMSNVLWGAIALDALLPGLLLLVLYRAAWKARYRLSFLGPMEYRVLIALADVLVVGGAKTVPPEDVARNVERYTSRVHAHRRWVYRAALIAAQLRPLLSARPPLSELEPGDRRDFLVTRFERLPGWPRMLKNYTQIIIRICQQLSYAGYYGDARTFPSIGYQPFSQRPRFTTLSPPPQTPGPHPLTVELPGELDESELNADVCIVGSGAGGAILAYELAERGRDVLILERGKYVEPRNFTEDEVEMIGQLYADGILQQTMDFRFTVLQGSCVGGSTTVNNAVCFRPPERVLAKWNDPHIHDAGLDLAALERSVDAVWDLLKVQSQASAPLNPSGGRYVDGARMSGLSPGALEVAPVNANIEGCYGCGYCNIGCKWGKKLSMLETALPWAQRKHPGKVRIVAECEVERLRTVSGHPKRCGDARCRLSDGRRLTVRAKTFVVAAGAVGSSYLLLRSGIGDGLPVGRKFSANMGAPVTAEFRDRDDAPVNAFDGLQISHYGLPRMNGFAFETWFNPPVAQALNMPGWFEQHFRNMQRYDHLMAVGVLVGTEGNGQVKRALTGGPDIAFTPGPGDLRTLGRGLRTLAGILLEAGATRVMLNTWGYDEFTRKEELGRIDEIVMDPDYITLGTGHPQGGNAISRDPAKGVVGPDFRVHGYENLYVCDASVFPSSLTVNPQLTVMSLAHYAAGRIA